MTARTRVPATLIVAVTLAVSVLTATAASAEPGIGLDPRSISKGKPTLASSQRTGHASNLSTDNDLATRWESTKKVDPQWITVDLLVRYHILGAKVHWAADCAKAFRYELSNDAVTWTTLGTRTDFTGGDSYLLLNGRSVGRYLRIFGTKRCHSSRGYAINEIEVFGSVADTVPPTAPGDLRASGINGTSVSLIWTRSTDNLRTGLAYDIYAGTTRLKTAGGSATMVTGLTPATDYLLSVVARDYDGNLSPPSNTVAVHTGPVSDVPSPPSAVVNVRPVAISTTCFTVIWDPSTDNTAVARYDVYVSGQPIQSVPTATAETCGLTPNTTYGVAVTAWDTDGNVAEATSTRSVATLPG